LSKSYAVEVRPGDEGFATAAYWAGLLHDLGKYRAEFQQLLLNQRAKGESTRHKSAGAAEAGQRHRVDVAYAIAGHHGGIPDRVDLQQMVGGPGGLDLARQLSADVAVQADLPELTQPLPSWAQGNDPIFLDLWVRLLFSCLVDADWSDTSAYERRMSGLPPEPDPPVLDYAARLEYALGYIERRSQRCRDERLRIVRNEILAAALRAAERPPGLFSMTVPTGGGKTLSALAFALEHARRHGLRRIIYVAPYLSIIEQNAAEIRRALGADNTPDFVFEHHSLAEPAVTADPNEPQAGEISRRAENWDAPIIISTSVQFFESLFSNRPSACRKLHNIARSVVILDECQTLPPRLVAPTCSMLQAFSAFARCSMVFCTATQPAWTQSDRLPSGLKDVREVIPEELNLFARLRRVRVHWPKLADPSLDWAEVAARMAEQPSVLCVVNTKRAARNIFEQLLQLGCGDAVHLSSTMCPAHRLSVLDEVRRRLAAGERCRLVSTQLIEAGVDVDFPVVLREMGPLEGIVQASGRCNREGLLNSADATPGGRVTVFRSRDGSLPPDRWYRAARDTLEQNFLAAGKEPDIDCAQDLTDYFARLYRAGSLDEHAIQEDRSQQRFATVCEKYRLIDDATTPVVVATWENHRDEIAILIDQARADGGRLVYRQLARFQVNMRHDEVLRAGSLVASDDSGPAVWLGTYDANLGLDVGGRISPHVI